MRQGDVLWLMLCVKNPGLLNMISRSTLAPVCTSSGLMWFSRVSVICLRSGGSLGWYWTALTCLEYNIPWQCVDMFTLSTRSAQVCHTQTSMQILSIYVSSLQSAFQSCWLSEISLYFKLRLINVYEKIKI